MQSTVANCPSQPGNGRPPGAALPPFPAVARRLLTLIADESASMNQISQLVRTDAAFSAQVLRLANSAVLGLRYEVVSILHAVSVLGTDRLRALILTVGLQDYLRSARSDELIRRCWRHNLASALVCEWLAPACWLDKATAYTAGLLHSVGRLALMTLHPGRYTQVLDRHRETGEPVEACERAVLGADHHEVAARVAEDWNLPASLRALQCVNPGGQAEDGDSGSTPVASAALDVGSLAAVGCETASRVGFSFFEPLPWDRARLEALLPGDVWQKVSEQTEELRETVPYKINLFECEFL